jgi:hypothetical protein
MNEDNEEDAATAAAWRVWIRDKNTGYFLEAFKHSAKRPEMIKTVQMASADKLEIKVMNINSGVMLSDAEIQSILE